MNDSTTVRNSNSDRPSDMLQESIRGRYQQRVNRYQGQLDILDRRSSWLSRLRGVTFFLAVGGGVWGWASDEWSWVGYGAAGLLFATFLALAAVHENVLSRMTLVGQRRRRCLNQIARSNRRWERVESADIDVPDEHQAVASDLDLFGGASLFRLISTAHTPIGLTTLRRWLLVGADPDEILARQQAVGTLAGDESFREELELRCRMLGRNQDGPTKFADWAEGPLWLARRGWLEWLTRGLTILAVALPACGLAGLLEPAAAFVGLLVLIALNVTVNVVFVGSVHEIFNTVSSRNNDLQHYRHLFELIAERKPDCDWLDRLQATLGATPREPLDCLRGLARIIGVADLRRDGLFGAPYLLSQILLLTDFHVLCWLERWQRRHGRAVRGWLESVGRLEAVCSLATLAFDNPDWTLPVVSHDNRALQATSLGHPLLADDACVRNDVQVGPAGAFLLVTGSNMSGKSTLLRSIGVNVALAQAGGPVCAAELTLPPLRIATSMRINDSLADGVSFFMAELKRMKRIVDLAREVEQSGSATLLY